MTDAETRRAQKSRHYQKHREKILARVKAYQELHPEVNREACRRYRAAHPERRRDTILRNLYRMGLDEFNRRITQQNGQCISCGNPPRRWYVDHDHNCCPTTPTCGRCTRGLVCNGCNTYDRMSEPWVDKMGRQRGRKTVEVNQ